MIFSIALIAISILLSPFLQTVSANDFVGVNSYFLYALSSSDRSTILDALQDAQIKTIRIFITQIDAGTKGSSAVAVNDIETAAVGSYDDTILGMIDTLALEAQQRGIKLIIAMHDRYALGCWQNDGYVSKYGLPSSANSGCNPMPASDTFYTNQGAISDFDNRLNHILNYKSTSFDGTPFSQLSQAIYAFEVQNEGFGHMTSYPDWTCGRAQVIKQAIGSSEILVSNGGGTDLPSSLLSSFFSCEYLDVVALHDYNIDPSYVGGLVEPAKATAIQAGKTLFYEEYGATGDNKQSDLQNIHKYLVASGIPFSLWEVMIPSAGASNYEIAPTDPEFSDLKTIAQQAITTTGEFYNPEIDNGVSSS